MTAGMLTIAIASSGRASLRRCLLSLAAIEVPTGIVVREIVVADDGPPGAVANQIAAATPMPFPVRALPVGARNVSIARNACLDAADGTLLAFVDDDEWVAVDWLARMVAAMREFEADCVFGPVHPVYPQGTPDWIVRANPLHVDWGSRGRRVHVGRSGNTLMKLLPVTTHGLRFDPALGRTGGEDTSFFHAYGATGARMIVTDDAIIREEAPPARVDVAYFRHRALRTGQIYARFVDERVLKAPTQRSRFYAGAALKAAVALGIGAVVYPFDRALWLKFAMRGWMNVGKLRELLGLSPAEMR